MKKQISLFTLAAASIAMSALQVSAQTKINMNDVNPPEGVGGTATPVLPSGMANPETITISGNIPEFIQFTSVDNLLELRNLGGPTNTGRMGTSSTQDNGYVASQKGGSYNDAAGAYYVYPDELGIEADGSLTQTPDGKAGVQFRSNTYIAIQSRVDSVRNVGPDGLPNTSDDVVLTTGLQTRFRGLASVNRDVTSATTFVNGAPPPTGSNFVLSANNANSTTGRGYTAYSNWKNVTSSSVPFEQIIFKPGMFSGSGSTVIPAMYSTSGYMFKVRVKRDGLNDYRGDYAGKINLTYYKF